MRGMAYRQAVAFYGAVALVALWASSVAADTLVFTIVNDAALDQGIANARAAFLAGKPYASRLDATILVPQPDGTWRRGSYNPDAIAYPASCVKLAYLAAAMYWERTNGHPYDYLDWCVRPMIVDSDNVATGSVVDAITGAPNYQTSIQDSTFWAWYAKRQFTENYLTSRNLLENQITFNKTYPSNSGSGPTGAESLGLNTRGGNRMQPKCSASLMLEIVKGAIEPGATTYMRQLLTHDRWVLGSELGFGLPPGAVYENKRGDAYDTLEDIAHIILPNGQEFILAAFSNGYAGDEPNNPEPYDLSFLGGFCEAVIDELGLNAGCPPKIKIDNPDPAVAIAGSWAVVTDQSVDYDMYGASYLSTTTTSSTATASVTWNLNVPSAGKYEVCVWSPLKNSATTIQYTVNHAAGATPVSVDQRYYGGRWYRLGDFDFSAGQGSVVLTNHAGSTGKVVMADAVKITKWPTADSEPPGTPTGLAANVVSSTAVQLSWTPSTDNVAVVGYEVRRSGTIVGSSTSAGYTDGSATANTTYTYDVRAKDAALNYSGWSSPVGATTLSLPPDAGNLTPNSASACVGDDVVWTAVGGFGAGRVQYYRYAWNQTAGYTFTGREPAWSAGTIATQPTAPGAWYLHVQGYNAADVANGTYDGAVSVAATTVITGQPTSQEVVAGVTVQFSVTVTGATSYQWQKDTVGLGDGGRISGATTPTLILSGVIKSDAGSYRCTVSGDCGSVTSDSAVLSVNVPLSMATDFDGDADVDLNDFTFFRMCYNGPNRALPYPECAIADLDDDNDVDLEDFSFFRVCFNGPNRSPACQ